MPQESPSLAQNSRLPVKERQQTSGDFAILTSADNFKDYVKSYFSGAVTWARVVILVSRSLLGQEPSKGLFSLFGCLRHAFKKAG
jgi:hypothetical protein